MKTAVGRTLATCLIVTFGCKDSGKEVEPGKFAETGGDDGIFAPNIDLPSGETDGDPDPVYLPTGECIQFPQPYVYGYVHQCEGSARLKFVAGPKDGEDFFTFGPGQSNPAYWLEPDDYDLPLVAACCGPFNYEEPTSVQKRPYINNCLADAAQQICHAIPYFLRRQAEKADGLIEKALIISAAKDAESKAGECLLSLWSGGPTVDEPTRLLNRTWSPSKNVTFTLVDAEVTDWTKEGDVAWNTCSGFYDNDPAVIPTAPFQIPGTIGMSQGFLAPGTAMTGSGPFESTVTVSPSTHDSSLTISFVADGALHITGLRLEAGPATARVNGEDVKIRRSSVLLRDVLEPQLAGGEYTVDIGAAYFTVTVVTDGDSRIIDFTNSDPIVFRLNTRGDWEFDPFDLVYVEQGIGTWTLAFNGMLFQPGR
jgi:hypothetical protein